MLNDHPRAHHLRKLAQSANEELGRPMIPYDEGGYSTIGHILAVPLAPESDRWSIIETANIYGAYNTHYAAATADECAAYLRGMIGAARSGGVS